MTDELVTVIRQISDLLLRCNRREEGDWLVEHLDEALRTPDFDWAAFRADLHRKTVGMGSLTDISLSSPGGSGLDASTANRRLYELADKLFEITK